MISCLALYVSELSRFFGAAFNDATAEAASTAAHLRFRYSSDKNWQRNRTTTLDTMKRAYFQLYFNV